MPWLLGAWKISAAIRALVWLLAFCFLWQWRVPSFAKHAAHLLFQWAQHVVVSRLFIISKGCRSIFRRKLAKLFFLQNSAFWNPCVSKVKWIFCLRLSFLWIGTHLLQGAPWVQASLWAARCKTRLMLMAAAYTPATTRLMCSCTFSMHCFISISHFFLPVYWHIIQNAFLFFVKNI